MQKSFEFSSFLWTLFLMFWFRSKVSLETFQLWLVVFFRNTPCFLIKNRAIFKNWNYLLKCREQKKNSQKIVDQMFWNSKNFWTAGLQTFCLKISNFQKAHVLLNNDCSAFVFIHRQWAKSRNALFHYTQKARCFLFFGNISEMS